VFGLGPATRVYLAVGATDLRKGFEGLYGLVRDRLRCEPMSGHLFLFSNSRRNRLKMLYWDGYVTFAIMGQMLCRTCLVQKRAARPGPILKSLKKGHYVRQCAFWRSPPGSRFKLRKNLVFHCEVSFEITMSSGNLLMTQPQCDDLQGNTGLKQVHGGCMATMSLKT
jgi:IS66 Orf2 like protein